MVTLDVLCCNYRMIFDGYDRWIERRPEMELMLLVGVLVGLAMLAYFFGYDSRDCRPQVWW
jgi:hypothetical protein